MFQAHQLSTPSFVANDFEDCDMMDAQMEKIFIRQELNSSCFFDRNFDPLQKSGIHPVMISTIVAMEKGMKSVLASHCHESPVCVEMALSRIDSVLFAILSDNAFFESVREVSCALTIDVDVALNLCLSNPADPIGAKQKLDQGWGFANHMRSTDRGCQNEDARPLFDLDRLEEMFQITTFSFADQPRLRAA